MQVHVNGAAHDVPDGTSVSDLLSTLGLGDKPCAVEVNTTVIPKADHASCTLHGGDTIELVTLVGGG